MLGMGEMHFAPTVDVKDRLKQATLIKRLRP